jgi:hypothetical protein
MRRAHIVAICPAAFWPGNVCLVEAAALAAEAGHVVVVLEPVGGHDLLATVGERDFTGGRAVEAYRRLVHAGAAVAEDATAIVQIVARIQYDVVVP